jgi:hypothetical protein
MYSSTLSLTAALAVGGLSAPRPGRFTPGKKTRYPFYRRLGGPQGRSGRVQKISLLPGFDPRTVRSRYTDWTTPAQIGVPVHVIKAYAGVGGYLHIFLALKLDEVVVSFNLQRLYLCRNICRCSLNRKLCGLYIQYETFIEENHGIELRSLCCPARSLLSIPREAPRLSGQRSLM